MTEKYPGDDVESPKKGPTLSTSTSSFEALDPHDPNLSQIANTMFQKTGDYISGELTLAQEDYKLLESMNNATVTKFADMRTVATNIQKSMSDLNDKFKSLEPYLEQIAKIEDSAMKLEQAAYKLDNYTKRIEAKFKMIEKKT
ncbi:unnamed protein product [Bemisia tabaci]|uniref:Biogenesis of lysosome-related organelles complex 1 subunit 2 n=1 Tax=Bemisia tabaci TaxID=7038 RepID=A0A9P0F5T3_BEMTA|nr:PREDICTED: biogenesis of lysosome-related organelles complex 1 subunit 2 [Bemisia tabaci]CAH0393211.1 unnamed protein product [Bemisia tabaci]CAH0775421.1 unnamed protein product [Bemisia tabaci]